MADASEYADTFNLIDTNDDGRICAAELKHLMHLMGEEITDIAAEEVVFLLDGDDDGLITLEEFAEYLSIRTC